MFFKTVNDPFHAAIAENILLYDDTKKQPLV